MKRLLIASSRESAGKTSLILGMAAASGKKFGYLKPFGDRLIYQRKKNWDYDSNLIINAWGLNVEPDSTTLGFNHSKLRYVYDEESLKKTLPEMARNAEEGKDGLIIEGGKDLTYGSSINLDSLSIARYTDSQLLFIVSGENDVVLDDIRYIQKNMQNSDVDFAGIIINKVHDADDFKDSFLKILTDEGVSILGIIPHEEELTNYSIRFLSDSIFAKVIAGETGLDNTVENIIVCAMSTEESMRHPVFNKKRKLIITSGDRSDMILAALGSDTAAIVLTNNIVPPSSILSKASEQNIPLLLVTNDTYQVAKQIDKLEALITINDIDKINFMGQLVTQYIDINSLV